MVALVQWQRRSRGCWHGAQAAGWHRLGHEWVHPAGRGLLQGREQSSQLLEKGSGSGSCGMGWHCKLQLWLPQGSGRPQGLGQEKGPAPAHALCTVMWPPWQVAATGCVHGGQGVSSGRAPDSDSRLAAAAAASAAGGTTGSAGTEVLLLPPGLDLGAAGGWNGATGGGGGSWQTGLLQAWPQPGSTEVQRSLQGGHGP